LFFKVPLDYSKPTGEHLRLFTRTAERVEKPVVPTKNETKQLPLFLYLQGGPGGGCPPVRDGGWSEIILDKGYKIVLMDQRGAGLSNTITTELLAKRGGPSEQASYLKFFRADNIIRDAEAIRKTLTKDYPEGNRKWSILGQSFGGFCCVHYLSKYPEGLREVFTTGGLPPLVKQPDSLYERLCQKLLEVNRAYYESYPDDIGRVHKIIKYLENNQVSTYNGGLLTPERIQNLGLLLGFHGTWTNIHDLLLRMANDLEIFQEFSRPTIVQAESQVPFDNAILYAVIHEACYLSGAASNWSAERVLDSMKEFNIQGKSESEPIMLKAEMITHKTFEAYDSLQKLLPVAELIAEADDWPELYDEEQLARNEVPVYAATYVDDLYVDFGYAQETAKKIKGCKVYITNTMFHDGLRSQSRELMDNLFKLRDDVWN
jgi:pimeloyl-ACP methyl ester carboxylesterase